MFYRFFLSRAFFVINQQQHIKIQSPLPVWKIQPYSSHISCSYPTGINCKCECKHICKLKPPSFPMPIKIFDTCCLLTKALSERDTVLKGITFHATRWPQQKEIPIFIIAYKATISFQVIPFASWKILLESNLCYILTRLHLLMESIWKGLSICELYILHLLDS